MIIDFQHHFVPLELGPGMEAPAKTVYDDHGVPSYSFFRGRSGMVDEALNGEDRLVLLATADEVAARMPVVRREGTITLPAPDRLVAFICDAIEAASR